MLASQVAIGDATVGLNYTLTSITAVVLGGASIFGGRGSFIGALCGAVLIQEIVTSTTFLQIGTEWQYYLPGILILAGAGIYSRTRIAAVRAQRGDGTRTQLKRSRRSMADKKIIAVVGATGAQGGGLVRAILERSERRFAARAITRDRERRRRATLAALGAEVVARTSTTRRASRARSTGAYGAYCVTNYWEHFSPAKELARRATWRRPRRRRGCST